MIAAPRISDADIERARAVDLVRLVEQHGVKLTKRGKRHIGPCVKCRDGRDRFSVEGQLFYCRICASGGRGAVDFMMWLTGCDFRTAVERLTGGKYDVATLETKRDHGDDETGRIRKARFLWSQRKPITGTIAERYLRDVRRITCPLPPTLGFLPAWRDVPPRMIAAFALCDEPEPGLIVPPRTIEGVHLTHLRLDGSGKADMPNAKQFRGVVLGKPIVISPVNDLLGLGITEGIEDALSFYVSTGMGMWAAGAAGFMPRLAVVIPDYVESLTIFAHDDVSGRRGALDLAEALCKRGDIEVRIEGTAP